jgi:hypothetical protein
VMFLRELVEEVDDAVVPATLLLALRVDLP